ncbi:MAG: Fic family protein [Candidatus Margulisiibacteriota bacterium]|nr:Fic family protein [Candidatus Margulisiibacteriota bacterium]
MPNNYIAQIKAILNATGWSQVKLAQEIGVTFAALNRWLNQRAKPRPSTQKEIYRVYKEEVGILPLPDKNIRQALHSLDREKKKHKNIKKIIKENKHLREDLLLELTYNSNAIEGSTLTKKQTETIIFDKAHIPDKSYVEHLEATNHAVALNMIFDGKFKGPITEKIIKKLHGIILQGINPDAGKYSKHHRAIRGVDLILPHPEDIQEEIARLLRKINRTKEHIVKHIAKMHAAFEAIHPFGDGNGRAGRLIMIIQLLNAGYAPCLIENNQKTEYYEDLEYAQKKSETHLIEFIIECIQKGYQLVRKHKK